MSSVILIVYQNYLKDKTHWIPEKREELFDLLNLLRTPTLAIKDQIKFVPPPLEAETTENQFESDYSKFRSTGKQDIKIINK